MVEIQTGISGTKALNVPEILGAILGYATPPTLASAARVSKTWSTTALDKLWSGHNVNVVDLLQILPLDLGEDLDPPNRFWEFSLSMEYPDENTCEAAQAVFDRLATARGLRLRKFKVTCPSMIANPQLAVSAARVSAANKDSIEVLELSGSYLDVSLMADYSLRNLKALSFSLGLVGSGEVLQSIRVLVECCPYVTHLRLHLVEVYRPTQLLDLPGVRMLLAWNLLSFEVRLMGEVLFSNAIEEIGKAWPKLKKLNLNWSTGLRRCNSFPYSRLAEIVATFPELEDLEARLYYGSQYETLLNTYQAWPEHCRPSCLQKLRLGESVLPESQIHRDSVAQFLARLLPPGLRIDRSCHKVSTQDPVLLAAREKARAMRRDFDPEWDDLFRKVEELHGGVQIWVGSIPGDEDGVWF
ncbi:hypothetical protein FRC01_006964 [Tulasnella sp. 417]|nr:hypothetical protein FRC01_006964 [Tulasnella sp. 417]